MVYLIHGDEKMKHFGGLKFSSGLVFGGKIFTVLDVFTVENNGLFGVTWTVGLSGGPLLAYYWTYFGFINSSSFLLPCHSYTHPPPTRPLCSIFSLSIWVYKIDLC